MNELLLIDMLSELNPELLQDNYMERDLKGGVFSFLKKLFSLKKTTEQSEETFMQEESSEASELIYSDYSYKEEQPMEAITNELKECESKTSGFGFSIHIFQKKINIFVKIVSGITATLVLVIGILLFFITKNKGSFLLKRNKAALN
ncbi:hypothetical protein acsn021_36880 [Anaerocolumna cellulosilytica]|uniref:Uncharacterized protein n=1 Tax=Anaerocolumna cellulosilytica TaxID=433286 RepID=A0A6S6R433_9FIRM|nr:hypothetical protein [Anaerocolumna cellulosilytica]MBB5195044.1 ABC-type bacteriocin/lantibiotic exporter with double-glycine peptidase domain [Anaerocolumna cellulosilytica]BCJ96119.1 hypothetical protein acsn021_36880 [Anaerocolumna cellulosilytica]